MKNIFLLGIVFVGLFFYSCDKDNEHTSLIGSWNCEEFPEQTMPRNYQVSIMHNTYLANKPNEYVIHNFYNLGNTELIEVYFSQDTITMELIIPSQQVQAYTIFGSGIVSSDFSQIKWEYTISSGLVNEKVVANYY